MACAGARYQQAQAQVVRTARERLAWGRATLVALQHGASMQEVTTAARCLDAGCRDMAAHVLADGVERARQGRADGG